MIPEDDNMNTVAIMGRPCHAVSFVVNDYVSNDSNNIVDDHDDNKKVIGNDN